MYQTESAWRKIVPFIFVTLLVLGVGSRAEAITCPDFAAAHCQTGVPVSVDTLVRGGFETVDECKVTVNSNFSLRFKNPGEVEPCIKTTVGDLEIIGGSSSSLRVEFTILEAENASIKINSFGELTKIDDGGNLMAAEDILITTTDTDSQIVFENSSVLGDAGGLFKIDAAGDVVLKDSDIDADTIDITGSGSDSRVQTKKMDLIADSSIKVSVTGMGMDCLLEVRDGMLWAPTIDLTTTEADCNLQVKKNVFTGTDVTIDGAGNTFVYMDDFTGVGVVTVSGNPCSSPKNSPPFDCS